MASETTTDDLIALEREGWDALCTTDGALYYRARLADDAVMVFASGTMDRGEALAAMERVPPWSDYAFAEAQVLRPGPGVGVVVYRVTAHRPGQGEYLAWISSIYVAVDGDWKMVLHQQSPGGN